MNEQEFAQRLRQYRKNKGMTQQELADQLGVSNKTVSRWESGSYPDVTTLVALARVLGVTVDELLDPKTSVRTLEKSDWQNLLSFAFAIGGGLLFYLLAQFVPLPLCWALYLGCLAYGIYLQAHYTYHTHWFQLGVWVMVFFVSWSVVGMLLSGAGAVLGAVSMATLLERFWYVLEMGTSIGGVVLHLLVYFLIWTGLTIALSYLTVYLARKLAREPVSGHNFPWASQKEIPRLRLCRTKFYWMKAVPALAPLILMGYWCLFWRDDLPGWLYVSQEELYLPVWAGISLLTMLPLLKKGRRGMLVAAIFLTLTDLGFSGLLAYPRAYNLLSERVVANIQGNTLNVCTFGQASEELVASAIVLALLYLICCFIAIKRVPKEEKKEETEPEESGTF